MLQHTLERAVRLSGIGRTLVVVAQHHAPEVWKHLDKVHREQTVLQPRNCGTAPGIFLPLAHICASDPEAIVVILPSDHFVFPEDAFLTAVRRVARAAHRLPDKLVLLGARADRPETEYGWIQPGRTAGWVDGHAIRTVASFREKPNLQDAEHLLATGGLWNTMVMAAQVKTLWELGWCWLPEMMKAFGALKHHLGTEREQQVLDSIYESLPSSDFSSHLVERVPGSTVVVELRDVVWSDWGNEERIVETLRQIGKRPWFVRKFEKDKGRSHYRLQQRLSRGSLKVLVPRGSCPRQDTANVRVNDPLAVGIEELKRTGRVSPHRQIRTKGRRFIVVTLL